MGASRLILALACVVVMGGCGSQNVGGDAVSEAHSDTAADTVADAPTDSTGAEPCSELDYEALIEEVELRAQEVDPCFTGWVGWRHELSGWVVGGSTVSEFAVCGPPDRLAAAEGAIIATLNEIELPCIPDELFFVHIQGDATEDFRQLELVVGDSCPPFPNDIIVQFNSEGQVADVIAMPGEDVDTEALECVMSHLDGLMFPCLAGYNTCYYEMVYD